MKKTLVIVLALVLMLGVAACGEPAAPPTTTPPGDNATATPVGDASAPPTTEQLDPTTDPADVGGPRYGGTIRLNSTAEGAAPVGATWKIPATEVWFLYPMLETLVNELPDGTIVPRLAVSWDVDFDNATVTWHLREGVKFHDGSDFNAEVVEWNLKMIETDGLSTVTWTDIEVLGDYEIKVTYEAITNSTLSGYSYGNFSMSSKVAYETNGEEWLTENPVGTGPYKFVEYSKSAYMKFVRFDDYWQEGKPYCDALEIHLIRDTMTQNIALQSTGEQGIDMLSTQNSEQIKTFADQGFKVFSTSTGPMNLIPSSGNANSPFANPKVREALSYAIDRDAICAARGFGVLKPAYQIISPDHIGHSTDPDFGVPAYDLEKAKVLMTEAGYADGFTTTLYGQPGMADRDIVVAIQAQLAQIGIDAAVEMPDSGGYTEVRNRGWEGIIVQHNRAMPRMESSFRLLYWSDTRTISSIAYTQEFEDLIDAAVEKYGDNSAELTAVQGYLLDNFITIPLYYTYESWIDKPNVEGYTGSSIIVEMPDLWLSE